MLDPKARHIAALCVELRRARASRCGEEGAARCQARIDRGRDARKRSGGQRLNIEDFGNRLGLSDAAKSAIKSELKSSAAVQEVFQFDATTYKSLVAFKSVELSNGALLTADTAKFDKVFQQEPVDGTEEIKFVTRGQVIDEKLKTGR